MKVKIIFGVLSIALLAMSILLLIPEEKNLRVITSPKIYSILKSSDTETFTVTLLVNKQNTFYFNEEYISSISLNKELDEEIIPLNISNIKQTNDKYIYQKEVFFFVELSLKIGFDSTDYQIDFEKAFLEISYLDEEILKLYIGEFNYRFYNVVNTDLTFVNLSSTVFEINGVKTVSGVFIELANTSDENLVIKSLNLGNHNVMFNNFFLQEVQFSPDLYDSVEQTLNLESYNYEIDYDYVSKSLLLRENQTIMLYIPINYVGDVNYIHRFYFEVFYEYNNIERYYLVDDFPYINTSIFTVENEALYNIYELDN